ncbi:unnamed protein product [Caenorhabditis sp. 36 PRJEB53466]|nr:unnamed protein product [Caenorhabditis sp. 36 PRJEB53466]
MVRNLYICFLLVAVLVCLFVWAQLNKSSTDSLFLVLLITLFYSSSLTQLLFLLLSLLGFQRFFLHFVPSTERFLTFSHKPFEKFIKRIQFLYLLKEVIHFGCLLTSLNCLKGSFVETFLELNWILFLSQTGLFLISLVLYVPVMISIWKKRKLATAIRTRPDKYLLLQTLMIFILKMCYGVVPFLLLNEETTLAWLPFQQFSNVEERETLLPFFHLCDVVTAPLVIQFSFLMSSRKNMETIRSNHLFMVILSLISPNFRALEPPRRVDLDSTRNA